MQTGKHQASGVRVLGWVLYGMAVIVLAGSVLAGLSVSNASSVIPAAMIGFQSPALKPIWDALVSGLRLVGLLLFAFGFTVAFLFAAIGLLLDHVASLERRLVILEAAPPSAADSAAAGPPSRPLPHPPQV